MGKVKSKSKEVKKAAVNEETNDVPEKGFDYGGLPDRNLKKNLGCG